LEYADKEITDMKPFLSWRDDWLLGFEDLDEQHLELVEVLNNLHRCFLQEKDAGTTADMDNICQQLSLLRKLTRRHFQSEEDLMQKYEYPGLEDHHREHVMLLAELQLHIREIEAGSKPFSLGTLTAIKHWQIDHLLYSDRKFADFLMCRLAANEAVDFADKIVMLAQQQSDYCDVGGCWRKYRSG
jgi:hemerythrin-like metal-binding protein